MFGYISLAYGVPTENSHIADMIQTNIHRTVKKSENVGISIIIGLFDKYCDVVLNTDIPILIALKQMQHIIHEKPASAHRI
jgi:hypothetical protein